MATLNLSTIRPDPDDLKQQLESFLLQKDTWRGNVESAVGQTLLEAIAAVGALDQAKIRRARQEAVPETAVSDRAIYSLADFQGVRIGRKSPASVTVQLDSTSTVTIPPFTQFEGGGQFFFNRETIFLAGSSPQTVTLHQGTIVKITTPGIAEDYQMFFSPETGFQVSDTDVRVVVNATTAERAVDGVWSLRYKEGFLDRTLPDGRLAVQFGNGYYGSRPDATDVVQITYAVVAGSATNSLSVLGKSVYTSQALTVQGEFLTDPVGGTDQRPAAMYKNIAAPNFGSFGSAVTGAQHLQLALGFPGVVDAQMFSQRESNPFSLSWMNLIRVVLLTTSVWTPEQKAEFITYLQDHSMYTPRYYLETAVPVPVTVTAKVYCYNWADTGQVKLNVETALASLFEIRRGSLGYDFYLSDISRAIRNADNSIEYFELETPNDDQIFSSQSVKSPTLTVHDGIGSLPAGFYVYGIGVDTPSGFVTVKNYEYVQVANPSSSITVSWDPVPGGTTYKVYGRTSDGPRLLSTQSGTTFIDGGTIVPTTVAPPQSTAQVRYAVLANADISVYYSTRQARS